MHEQTPPEIRYCIDFVDTILNKLKIEKHRNCTYSTGRPVQFEGSNTFNKQGIPSVGMAPGNMKRQINIILNLENVFIS